MAATSPVKKTAKASVKASEPQVLPLREFRRLDLNAEEMGVAVLKLMDRAGKELAKVVQSALPAGSAGNVVLLCGKGNNGGDGYATALHLRKAGIPAVCVAVEDPVGPESRHHAAALAAQDAPMATGEGPIEPVVAWDAFKRQRNLRIDLIVDCLLGSGSHGRPRPPYDAAIRWINRQNATVIACDIPSGLGSSTCVVPDATLALHAVKEGMDKQNSGKIQVASIGIPARAGKEVGLGDLEAGYPVPRMDSHKGDNGHVLLVAGGPFTGAAHYAGLAAYRAGADLVSLWTPADAAAVIRSWGPDLLVHDACLGDHLTPAGVAPITQALRRANSLVIGPGLGTDEETRQAVAAILDAAAEADRPVVIDADALDAVTDAYLAAHGARTVLTPHAGEFHDLAGKEATKSAVGAYARRHRVTVLRKGEHDVIAHPERTKVCTRGHPTMTVGGTGDVLAGTLGALLAKGADPFDAACAAAYMVGVAGETAALTWSHGATASDIIEALPLVLHRLG